MSEKVLEIIRRFKVNTCGSQVRELARHAVELEMQLAKMLWDAQASPDGALKCRPVVLKFAAEMERVLRKNDFKGGWEEESINRLYELLLMEVDELNDSLKRFGGPIMGDVKKEAVDVANFAMMIADVIGMKDQDEANVAAFGKKPQDEPDIPAVELDLNKTVDGLPSEEVEKSGIVDLDEINRNLNKKVRAEVQGPDEEEKAMMDAAVPVIDRMNEMEKEKMAAQSQQVMVLVQVDQNDFDEKEEIDLAVFIDTDVPARQMVEEYVRKMPKVKMYWRGMSLYPQFKMKFVPLVAPLIKKIVG